MLSNRQLAKTINEACSMHDLVTLKSVYKMLKILNECESKEERSHLIDTTSDLVGKELEKLTKGRIKND